jgi:hypothetical protein
MKKVLFAFLGVLLSASVAFGQVGIGSISGSDFAAKADWDWDGVYGGLTGGTSGAIGVSQFNAQGIVFNGQLGFGTPGQPGVPATGMADAGADTESYAYHYMSGGWGTFEVGAVVGTQSAAFSGVNDYLGGRVTLNPSWASLGGFSGDISGFTAEGTKAGSMIGLPWMYDSHGFTYGAAEQGAIGGYQGAINGGALWVGEARAGVGAGIYFNGFSATESGRYAAWDFCNDTYTEGLYSKGISQTVVNTEGFAGSDSWGFADGNAYLRGGWAVEGSLNLGATQFLCDPAYATAGVSGYYAGSGGLNDDYFGEARGFAGTSITQVPNGVISQSAAGLSVTSVVNAPVN